MTDNQDAPIEKCLIEQCKNFAVTRGVCMSCRVSLSKASTRGDIKKEQIDKILLPHKRKRRKNKTMDWVLSKFKAVELEQDPNTLLPQQKSSQDIENFSFISDSSKV